MQMHNEFNLCHGHEQRKQQGLDDKPFLKPEEKSLNPCPNGVDSLENLTESLTNSSPTTGMYGKYHKEMKIIKIDTC